MHMQLPKSFVDNVNNTFGPSGAQWLNDLPTLVDYFVDLWGLSRIRPFENLSYNYTMFAHRHQKPSDVVLKLCIPNHELIQEIRTLSMYNGVGAVQLLNCEPLKGALLLEAAIPGTPLKNLFPDKDNEAVIIAASVIKKLHSCRLPKDTFALPKIEKWLEALNHDHAEIPKNLLVTARTLSKKLLSTQKKLVLLHGDLHHDNILLKDPSLDLTNNQDAWIAIDPKGVIGEAEYEVGAYMRNPFPLIFTVADPVLLTQQRLEHFSKALNFDKKRLIEWNFVQAVLATCWAIEDNTNWQYLKECAEFFYHFL